MSRPNDYYTTAMLHEMWNPSWFERFQHGKWGSGCETVDQSNPRYQHYHPYACHACKRGPLTSTTLLTCSSCRVVKYCSHDHQKCDWKFHKHWCRAFAQLHKVLDTSSYASREEWQKSVPQVSSQLGSFMKLRNHSMDIQIAVAQPRCRRCFKSGVDCSVELTTCPRCMGVAVCAACLKHSKSADNYNVFHCDTGDPKEECDSHLLSLCCSAMIVEQGTPLGIPSNTDAATYWNPRDWREYFERKRGDYEIPAAMFDMAPVVAFCSDAHSTVLSIQHILALPRLDIEARIHSAKRLVVHVCGASSNDEAMTGRYIELLRLNPQLTELQVHFIGPDLGLLSRDRYRQVVLQKESIRPTCQVTFENHKGLYHKLVGELGSDPTIVFCAHSGLDDPSYIKTWRPTIELLAEKCVPFVLTGYNHKEVVEDTALLRDWGVKVIVPPTPNPFRGLRPFLDPPRDPADHIYSNASFVVAQGHAR